MLQYDNVDCKNFNVNGSLHESLVHVAARNNNHEICKMLLKFGADVNMFDYEDQTLLEVAEKNTNYSICQLLIKKAKMQRKENFMQQSAAYLCEKKRFYYV